MQITTDPRFSVKPGNGGYTFDGKPLIRISTLGKVIDKPAVVPWAVGMACDHLEEHPLDYSGARKAHANYFASRGAYGTGVHDALDRHINACIQYNNGLPQFDKDINPFDPVWQFHNYSEQAGWTYIATEVPVYDAELGVGGKFDLVYRTKDGEYGIADHKNYKGFYNKAVLMQMAMYAHCLEGMSGEKVQENTALRYSDGNMVEIVESRGLSRDYEAACAALTLVKYGVLQHYSDGKWRD